MKIENIGVVLAAVACVTVVGCKDPDYVKPADRVKPAAAQPAENEVAAKDDAVAENKGEAKPAENGATAKEEAKKDEGTVEVKDEPKTDDTAAKEEAKKDEAPAATTTYIVQKGDTLGGIALKYKLRKADILAVNKGLDANKIYAGKAIQLPGKVEVGEQKPAAKKSAAKSGKQETKSAASAKYTGATKEYVVKGGDTLGGIAGAYGIRTSTLKEMNGLTKDVIRVGQKLKVPAEKQKSAAAADKKGADKKSADKKVADKKTATKTEAAAKDVEQAKAEEQKAADASTLPEETTAPATTEEPAPAAVEAPAAPAPAAPAAAPSVATVEYIVQEGEDLFGIAVDCGLTEQALKDLNNLTSDEVKPGQKIRVPAAVAE